MREIQTGREDACTRPAFSRKLVRSVGDIEASVQQACGSPVGSRCAEPVVDVQAASYVRGGYRSFEFVDLSARAGLLTMLLSGDAHAARDLLLCIAGAVRPTAGSLRVDDASFAAAQASGCLGSVAAWPAFRRKLRGAHAVGMGVFSGVADVDGMLTVEEAVVRELHPGGRGACGASGASDALDYLAQRGLATCADRRVDRLDPYARARLSAALALASSPCVAVIDLRDPCCAGLTGADERALAGELRAAARETGAAVIVSCAEVASAREADAVYPLDIATDEAYASESSRFPERVDVQ